MTRKTTQPAGAPTQRAEVIASTLAMGRSHHTQGHLKLAEDCYRRVLALDPNNAEACSDGGMDGHILPVEPEGADAGETSPPHSEWSR